MRFQFGSFFNIDSFPKITSRALALEIATLILFGHCKNPNPKNLSLFKCRFSVRTVDKIITNLS